MPAVSENLRVVWQQLSQRNDWALVEDQQTFLESAVVALSVLGGDELAEKRYHVALIRTYGVLLYRGLRSHQERAAYELWLACYRVALRDGWKPADAEEVAQESIARVIEKIHTLRAPESIISWCLRICRTVQRSFRQQGHADAPSPGDTEQNTELADHRDMVTEVEQRLLTQQLHELLRANIPNELERLVLLRVVILGDQPRDVAHALNVPLHRTRLAKSRALQRLRGNQPFLDLLNQLLGDIDHEKSIGGQSNDTETG